MVFYYAVFAIGYRLEIIVVALNMAFHLFVGINIAYARPVSEETTYMYIFFIIICLITATLLNLVIIYIGEVN